MSSNIVIKIQDTTTYTWQSIISKPPDGQSVPYETSSLCLKNTTQCKLDTSNRKSNYSPDLKNRIDWNPIKLAPANYPSYYFLKPNVFKKNNKGQVEFDLDLVPNPGANCDVKVFELFYPNGINFPPRFVGVIKPKNIDPKKPISFLVYFEHQPGQAAGSSLYKYFNPLGYDWMFFQLYSYINYNILNNNNFDKPLFTPLISSFGLAYQLEQSKKQYIILLPHINRDFNSYYKLNNYQFYSAEILREVIKLIAREPFIKIDLDKTELNVALASFSSGCSILSGFLNDNLISKNKIVQSFMQKELKEIFVFEPSHDPGYGDSIATSIYNWMNLQVKNASSTKCMRFYTYEYFSNLKKFNTPTTLKSKSFDFWQSNDNKKTIAYLPFTGANSIWMNSYIANFPHSNPQSVINWSYVHHQVPAMFLTDALRRSVIV